MTMMIKTKPPPMGLLSQMRTRPWAERTSRANPQKAKTAIKTKKKKKKTTTTTTKSKT